MRSIKGFRVSRAGPQRVLAEREAALELKYEFEVSADWKQIVRTLSVPHNAADRDPKQGRLFKSSCAEGTRVNSKKPGSWMQFNSEVHGLPQLALAAELTKSFSANTPRPQSQN